MVQERVAGRLGLNRLQFIVSAALASVFLLVVLIVSTTIHAEEPDRSKLYEPVYRVSKKAMPTGESPLDDSAPVLEGATSPRIAAATEDASMPIPDSHPLDPALAMARESLAHIEQNVLDYTCTLVKRERVQGELSDHEFMACKIRHGRAIESTEVPFGVYLNFLKPDTVRGREVVYVDGRNDGKLIAHEGGLKGRFLPTVSLLPTSALAMRGNRYPITEIGILTLTRRLIEKGERDRKYGECKVRMVDGAKVKDRVCTMLEVTHLEAKPQYDFHVARVYLDKELNIPIRYEAYGWPDQPGQVPPLLEEYTYMDLRLNVGLTDADFDPSNANYRF